MSKYGFNPDEVVTTKIDLIDKDGFHGVGEASNGGNSDEGSSTNLFTGLEEGVYGLGLHSNGNNHFYQVLFVFDVANHPELLDNGGVSYYASPGSSFAFYFGDKRDENDYHIQDESVKVEPIEPSESTILFGCESTSMSSNGVVNFGQLYRYSIFCGNVRIGDFSSAGYTIEFDPATHDGEPVHVMVPCERNNDGVYESMIAQIDAVWHYNPEVID